MHLSLSDVSASGISLTAEEAAAIALAAAHECDRSSVAESAVGLPASSEVLLDSSGRLWFSATGPHLADRERRRTARASFITRGGMAPGLCGSLP